MKNVFESKNQPPLEVAKQKKTGWHRILFRILEELLTPVGIGVFSDTPVMSNPPRVDIVLLRREGEYWSLRQRERLPDGIRNSLAPHSLIEFKFSQSVNLKAVEQARMYEMNYIQSQKLDPRQVSTFILSSKSILPKNLKKLEFAPTKKKGIYRGTSIYNHRITLILTNELEDTSYNSPVKIFASRRKETDFGGKGFDFFQKKGFHLISKALEAVYTGLWKKFFKTKGGFMKRTIDVDEVEEFGRQLVLDGIQFVSAKELLERTNTKQLLKEVGTKNLVKEVGTKNLVKEVGTKNFVKEVGTKNIVKEVGTKNIVKEVGTQQLLEEMNIEEIQTFLQKRKKQ